MYHVWKNGVDLPEVSQLKKVNAERITIKPFVPEADGYIFLHGVAIVEFKGRMYCAWAHNKVLENSDDEEINYAVSDDGGKTWSECIQGNCSPEPGVAVSHGVFLVHEEELYFFAPQFKGQLGTEMLKMSAYVFDEEAGKFHYLGVAMDERFWPINAPMRMENGNYIMTGTYIDSDYTSSRNAAAVAISRGSDILHWDMIKLKRVDTVRVWGECCLIINGSNCKMFCREDSKKLKALYAESNDYGRTWSELDLCDLPMIDSKPCSGTLSTGQHYLICSCAKDIASADRPLTGDLRSSTINGRDPLTIALTEKGEDKFSKIYTIDSGKVLSYPYAIELNQKLYVAYSSAVSNREGFNRNSAELAIIDLREFQ